MVQATGRTHTGNQEERLSGDMGKEVDSGALRGNLFSRSIT
jgi:hypothetical protein